MTPPRRTTRAESQQATRRRLLAAGAELARTRGLAAVTASAVSQKAGLSSGALYANFDSKEDVVIGFFDDMGLELRDMLAERPAEEPPFEALTGALGSPVLALAAVTGLVLVMAAFLTFVFVLLVHAASRLSTLVYGPA